MHDPWWRSAVMYQVYPRSFADTTGDGVGDLEGIRRHLDHLAWLGVDALWISPFYRSPMKDAGYDVSDFCAVDPTFGTLADFDRLLADAHERGLRVLVDWVPNHTSDQHPWFVASRSSRDDPKRDWYIWRDEPNRWRAALGAGSAWTWDELTEQHYLHLFLPEQPDLNWRNAEVVAAMHATLRFWLDRGVDGFRIDVAHCVGKDPDFADDDPRVPLQPLSDFNDQPHSHEVLRGVRGVLDEYDGRVAVGEVNIRSTEAIARYHGSGDELHLAFNFLLLDAPWEAGAIRRIVDEVEAHVEWPTWVLSNHDNGRHRSRHGGSEATARAAAVLLLGLRGTPFLYQGEELGLEDAVVTAERRVDPGGRDACRAPIPWEPGPGHGWGPATRTWLPFPPEAAERSAAVQRSDPSSVAHLYRRLLAARRGSDALRRGDFRWLPSPPGVLAWERAWGDDVRRVAVNLDGEAATVGLGGTVEVASDGIGEGIPFGGSLGPWEAVVVDARENP
jgi:alpha-glucosidase